jgi:hypothetical protein
MTLIGGVNGTIFGVGNLRISNRDSHPAVIKRHGAILGSCDPLDTAYQIIGTYSGFCSGSRHPMIHGFSSP